MLLAPSPQLLNQKVLSTLNGRLFHRRIGRTFLTWMREKLPRAASAVVPLRLPPGALLWESCHLQNVASISMSRLHEKPASKQSHHNVGVGSKIKVCGDERETQEARKIFSLVARAGCLFLQLFGLAFVHISRSKEKYITRPSTEVWTKLFAQGLRLEKLLTNRKQCIIRQEATYLGFGESFGLLLLHKDADFCKLIACFEKVLGNRQLIPQAFRPDSKAAPCCCWSMPRRQISTVSSNFNHISLLLLLPHILLLLRAMRHPKVSRRRASSPIGRCVQLEGLPRSLDQIPAVPS